MKAFQNKHRDLLNAFNGKWYDELRTACNWKQRFEKCADIFVKLELEPECKNNEGKVVGKTVIDPQTAKQKEQILIIKETDPVLAEALLQFIIKSLAQERHHHIRIQCVRLLKMILKSFNTIHFTNLKVVESLFDSIIGKCMTDRRHNLNNLVVPVLVDLWTKVCVLYPHTTYTIYIYSIVCVLHMLFSTLHNFN